MKKLMAIVVLACVLSLGIVGGLLAIVEAQVRFPLDHFACYRVFEPGPISPRIVNLADQFEVQIMAVLKPTLLCNPADKIRNGQNTSAQNRDAHLVCYAIQTPVTIPGVVPFRFRQRSLTIDNQFEQRTLTVLDRSNLLCVPSLKFLFD